MVWSFLAGSVEPILTVLACLGIVYYTRRQERTRAVVKDAFVMVVLTIVFLNLIDVVLNWGVDELTEFQLRVLKLAVVNLTGLLIGYLVMVLTTYVVLRRNSDFVSEFRKNPHFPFLVFLLLSFCAVAFTVLRFKPFIYGFMDPGMRLVAFINVLADPGTQVINFIVAVAYIIFPLVNVLVYLRMHSVKGKSLLYMYLILFGFAGAAICEYVFLILLASKGYNLQHWRSLMELALMLLVAYALKMKTFFFDITGEPEANLGGELKFKMEEGHTYLVEEESPERSFDMFSEQVTHGVPGLCITRSNPVHVKKRYGFIKTPVVWLTDTLGRGESTGPGTPEFFQYVPPHLEDISIIVNEFISENKEGVVLLDGIEYLITRNDYNKVVQLLDRLKDRVSVTNCKMIIPVNPKTLGEGERALLERELKSF